MLPFGSKNIVGLMLQYIGCLEVYTSMKSLDFETRSCVAKYDSFKLHKYTRNLQYRIRNKKFLFSENVSIECVKRQG